MKPGNRALFVSTSQILRRYSTDEPKRVVYIISDNPRFVLRPYQELAAIDLARAQPGEYFNEGFLGIKMFLPRESDLLCCETFGSHVFSMYKLHYCADHGFDDGSRKEYQPLIDEMLTIARMRHELPEKSTVQSFIMSLFTDDHSVRGATEGQLVALTTPCCDFFHADVDGIDSDIAGPIEEAFGLERFDFKYGLSCGSVRSRISDPDFHAKYPAGSEATDTFTLAMFIDMVYDILLIKYQDRL